MCPEQRIACILYGTFDSSGIEFFGIPERQSVRKSERKSEREPVHSYAVLSLLLPTRDMLCAVRHASSIIVLEQRIPPQAGYC